MLNLSNTHFMHFSLMSKTVTKDISNNEKDKHTARLSFVFSNICGAKNVLHQKKCCVVAL
jgi:hypothetical protein